MGIFVEKWFLEQEHSYYFLPLRNKYLSVIRASPVNERAKDLPTNAGEVTWVWSLDQEEPLKEEIATLSGVRA